VLRPAAAAAHLAEGFQRAGVEAEALPVADGGEGTAEVLHTALGGTWHTAVVSDPFGHAVAARWLLTPDGTAVIDSAEALGLPLVRPEDRDPLRTSSLGLGELMLATLGARPTALVVGLGGVATVDGGVGLRSLLGRWLDGLPLRVLCDVESPLLGPRGAAQLFGPQKGADAAAVVELERRLAARRDLEPYRDVAGAGAAGGLGAALAALGGELCHGAETVLDLIGFDERARDVDLVVTGEGTVDSTTLDGKAPGTVVRRCARLGVRCELFGGLVRDGVPARALSGDPANAAEDLAALGETLGRSLRLSPDGRCGIIDASTEE
jgi:glycerate kinase